MDISILYFHYPRDSRPVGMPKWLDWIWVVSYSHLTETIVHQHLSFIRSLISVMW